MSESDSADVSTVSRLHNVPDDGVSRVITFEGGQLAMLNDSKDWLTAVRPVNLRDWA